MSGDSEITFLERAKRLAKRGFHVFPLVDGQKTPAVLGFTGASTCDPEDLERFWVDPVLNLEFSLNIGIATSRFQNKRSLVVIDVDNKEDKSGSDELLKLELEGKTFPKTFEQKTPTGGRHLFYWAREPVKQGVNVLAPGLDVRSKGGYVVGAGSETSLGRYEIFRDLPVAECPGWIIEICGKAPEKKAPSKDATFSDNKDVIERAVSYLKNTAPLAIEGSGGDHTTFQVICRVKDFGLSEHVAADIIIENWNDRCQPPWDLEELWAKVSNAYRYGQNPRGSSSPESDFSDLKKAVKSSESAERVKSPIEKVNERYGLVFIEGKAAVIDKSKKKFSTLDIGSFRLKLAAETIQHNGKTAKLADVWLESPSRSEYEGVELLPVKETQKNVYNLWRGFGVDPLEEASSPTAAQQDGVSIFKEHLFENVCSKNQDYFNWLFGFCAHLFQKPWEKPLVSPVMYGLQGTGKTVIAKLISNLIGQRHAKIVADPRYLVGNFNAHLANLLFICFDEAVSSRDKAAISKLKHLITGDMHSIEKKGYEVYDVPNLTRVMMLSNDDWVVHAAAEERRFAVFDVAPNRKQDIPYFKKMDRLLYAEQGNRLLLREFLDFDLAKMEINKAPRTRALLEQKLESLDPVHSWWHDCLQEGFIVEMDFSEDWPSSVEFGELKKAALQAAKERGIKGWLPSSSSFAKTLKRAAPSIETARTGAGGGAKKRMVQLPALAQCRKEFEEFLGSALDWREASDIDEIDIFS